MNSFVLAALLQSAVVGAEPAVVPATYEEALQQTVQTGKPLVVLVGAEWCPACRTMKNSTLPKVKQDEVFGQISFATIDSDKQRDIAKDLTGGGVIPQLLMFERTADGWNKSRLVGSHSSAAVIQFLRKGVKEPTVTGAD